MTTRGGPANVFTRPTGRERLGADPNRGPGAGSIPAMGKREMQGSGGKPLY